MLLFDHPECCGKIQDKYEDQEFVMLSKNPECNVYHIKPVDDNGLVHTANQCDSQDLNETTEDEGPRSPNASKGSLLPSLNAKAKLINQIQIDIIMPSAPRFASDTVPDYQLWYGK